jgi:16S rRNA (adenine1518-N6/adenine1519-N6)-dimethyltransferase
MNELLDVVNERDEVVAQRDRQAVHAEHLIHRGVHVFVMNRHRQLLIQKRAQSREYYPGYFDASVGAHVSSGETYEHAAVRETQEELGFVPSRLIHVGDYHAYSDRQRENRRLYLCFYDGKIHFDREEVEAILWFTIEQIEVKVHLGEAFTQGFLTSLQQVKLFLNKL